MTSFTETEPLSALFTCPVCLDPLADNNKMCKSFQNCQHKFCAPCCDRLIATSRQQQPGHGSCPTCRVVGGTAVDHAFTQATQVAIAALRFKCDNCGTEVKAADRATHLCPAPAAAAASSPFMVGRRTALLTRFRAVAEDSGVDSASLSLLLSDLLEEGKHPSDEEISQAILAQAAFIRAAMERQSAKEQERLNKNKNSNNNKPAAADTNPTDNNTNKKCSSVFVDFDQFARGFSVEHVAALIGGIMKKLVDGKKAENAACVRVCAFGVPMAFSNERVLHQLTLMGVETRVVSSRKKEETDRQLEREANADEAATTVVLVSNDQDFMGLSRRLTLQGKSVIVVHSASNPMHARNLALFCSESWNWTEFGVPCVGSTDGAAAAAAQAAPRNRSPQLQRPAAAAAAAPAAAPNNNNARTIDVGTTGQWRADKNGMLFTFISISGNANNIYLAAPRLRGPAVNASSAPIDVVFVSMPNPADPGKHNAVAAFPLSWSLQNVVEFNDANKAVSITVGDCKPTAGLAQLLADPLFSGTKKLCPGSPCKYGSNCVHIHVNKNNHNGPAVPAPAQAARAAQAPPPPQVPQTIQVEGRGQVVFADVVNKEAVLNLLAKNPGATVRACNKFPECPYNNKCSFAHVTAPAAAAARRNNNDDYGDDSNRNNHNNYRRPPPPFHVAQQQQQQQTVLVAGSQVPVSRLEPTAFLEYAQQNPTKSGAVCRHHENGQCNHGAKCTFAHMKK